MLEIQLRNYSTFINFSGPIISLTIWQWLDWMQLFDVSASINSLLNLVYSIFMLIKEHLLFFLVIIVIFDPSCMRLYRSLGQSLWQMEWVELPCMSLSEWAMTILSGRLSDWREILLLFKVFSFCSLVHFQHWFVWLLFSLWFYSIKLWCIMLLLLLLFFSYGLQFMKKLLDWW